MKRPTRLDQQWQRIGAAALIIAASFVPLSIAHGQASGMVNPPPPPEKNRDFVIRPAALPAPALKYRLFPDRTRMLNRNAALYYHRAVASMMQIRAGIREQNLKTPDKIIPDLFSEVGESWNELPLDKIPVEDMRDFAGRFEETFAELERARISSQCEWGVLPDPSEKLDWFNIPLSELQQLRNICRILGIAIRVAAHDRDFDRAIHLIQIGYKIAHDVGKSDVLVGGLVGIACSMMMNDYVLQLIEQPGCPNLFWALADLPDPVCSVRESIRLELEMFSTHGSMEIFQTPEKRHWSLAGWRNGLDSAVTLTHGFDQGSYSPAYGIDSNRILAAGLVVRAYPAARQSLIDSGIDPAKVDEMPAIQVVAIQQAKINTQLSNYLVKALDLPYADALKEIAEFETLIEEQSVSRNPVSGSSPFFLIELLWPAVPSVLYVEAQDSRRLAALQNLEAIRAHAAEHGALPNSLDELSLPAPQNPATQQTFMYERQASRATLHDVGFNQHSWNYFHLTIED